MESLKCTGYGPGHFLAVDGGMGRACRGAASFQEVGQQGVVGSIVLEIVSIVFTRPLRLLSLLKAVNPKPASHITNRAHGAGCEVAGLHAR